MSRPLITRSRCGWGGLGLCAAACAGALMSIVATVAALAATAAIRVILCPATDIPFRLTSRDFT
jgi:hypothetical protein